MSDPLDESNRKLRLREQLIDLLKEEGLVVVDEKQFNKLKASKGKKIGRNHTKIKRDGQEFVVVRKSLYFPPYGNIFKSNLYKKSPVKGKTWLDLAKEEYSVAELKNLEVQI